MNNVKLPAMIVKSKLIGSLENLWRLSRTTVFHCAAWLLIMVVISSARAQVNVVTAHNDIARTGQNLNETILTPSNVNPTQFGKIFTQTVSGQGLAQPLYVSQVTIPGKGVHNVVYVATSSDSVYAFDADNNGGINATPLWFTWLANTPVPGVYNSPSGILGTPVIDLSSNTMYVVSYDNTIAAPVTSLYRLHALDITTGAEKFGGPVQIQGSVPGTGSGSSGSVLTFNPEYEFQRPGLLFLNGVVYIAFGSINDNGPWHGWVFSYNATNLKQIDIFCTTANGTGGGIWMGGAGLAAEVSNPAKPYGRLFVPTGNGTYSATSPYSNTMSYGMTMLDLDLTGGVMTVEDEFTPYDQAFLDAEDGDLGSGGPLLLPAQALSSGSVLSPLVHAGKSGAIYILNRNNLGGFNATSDQVAQEAQTTISGVKDWGEGVWGSEAYWNNNIYYGGLNNNGTAGSLSAYSFINGVLSTPPTSQTSPQFTYPGSTPAVSANKTTNGIVWDVTHGADILGSAELLAYDATNLATTLYSSNANLSRDNPGTYVKFGVPTIANGKVYVNGEGQLNVYGLLGTTTTVAPPVISPPGATFTGSQMVTITDATPGAQIFYTTDGSTPTVNSTLYNSSTGIKVTANETITAIASATGYLQGAPVSAVFSSTANAPNPVLSLAPATYSGTQSLTITDALTNATIHYTVDGSTPTTASPTYTGKFSVPVSETVQAIATAPNLLPSSIISAAYTINPAYIFNFSQGFAQSQELGQMQFNGSTGLDDFRLQLTDGGLNEAGSAFYTTPVPIWAFTTDFTFQLSNPVGDGITFTIQGDGPTALGASAQDLGYGGIANSVAIKFSIHGDAGEGNDSTGIYYNGELPAFPSIDLTNTGINLASGDYMNVHMTYDDKNLNITITDAITLASWSHSYVVNLPEHIGTAGGMGYVGFTGGTGSFTASQKVTSWSYVGGLPSVPNYPAGFDPVNGEYILALNGNAALSGTSVQLTKPILDQTSSAYYTSPVDITAFTTDFEFIDIKSSLTPSGGFTFVIQNASPKALGSGAGGLGYAGIPNSVAIKFDDWNDAGEGNDSTGVYVNGAMPTVPSINLTPYINLHGGDLINVHVTYNGTILTWVMDDLTSLPELSVSESVPINIPHTIGSNTAYVGFTAANGGEYTNQTILNWTFGNP